MKDSKTIEVQSELVVGSVQQLTARPSNALDMLDSVTKRGADVGTIETIAKLYREERDDKRRMAFDAAMAQAQSEMLRVNPDGFNKQTSSKYATYAALDRVLRPIYTAHGFGLSFNTVAGGVVDMVRVTCRVSHREGWGQDYQIDMPADGKGAKGGDVMTRTHAAGSAVSYGMRYLLKMIFNVAVGKDDDGNAAGNTREMIGPGQAKELREMCKIAGMAEGTLCTAYGASDVESIPLSMFSAAKAILNKRIDANMKGKQ